MIHGVAWVAATIIGLALGGFVLTMGVGILTNATGLPKVLRRR